MALVLSSSELRFRRQIREANEGRRRRRARRVPRATLPTGAEIRYRAQLVEIAREAATLIRETLLVELERIETEAKINRPDAANIRIDQVDEEIERVIGNVRIQFARRFTPERAQDSARTLGDTVNQHNLGQNNRQLLATVGIDLGAEPAIAPHLAEFARENVRLITTIPEKLLEDVEGIISRGARRGRRASEMATEIRDRFRITENRAKLIARDQTSKLNGELTQLRQTSLGIKKYIWRTAQDERVRDEHAEREGREFLWSQPPSDGHPGEPINCRCTAEPVIAELQQTVG
ncbi:hypothetical protein LCGC14_0375310 [marine sediment metagenome]|uniref:Phage head morphogenesis domain-containing protein n=1 Tax=marine sediment metagenome TaxID=412755 RepID=A0A0F9T9W1_9ZZZZ